MKKITTYLILTFLLSSIGYYLIVRSKDLGLNPSLVMFYLMWCPGVSGITTYLIYEKGLSGIGCSPGGNFLGVEKTPASRKIIMNPITNPAKVRITLTLTISCLA